MDDALKWINGILSALGTLVILGGVYVRATPSKADDAWFDKLEGHVVFGPIVRFLMRFSPVERRQKK